MLKTTAKMAKGEHVTIVCLGDSNTEVTFHTRGRLNWVGLLSEALFEAYGNGICTMINAGKCGDTFASAAGRLQRDVIRFMPDLVIVALGMNDAGSGRDGVSDFKNRARSCINLIHHECSSEIVLRTPNPVVTVNGLPLPSVQAHPGEAWEAENRPVQLYAQALVELGDEFSCPVVDHYQLWTRQDFRVKHRVADPNKLWPRMSDAIHPGPLGHLVFFRELAPLFQVTERFPWE